MHLSKPRPATIVFFVLAGTFATIRLWNLETFCLDSDEVWSLTCARSTWNGLFSNAAFDLVHPPLFYILLKIWVAIGGMGLFWVRMLPALISFAALIPFYFLCRSVGLGPWQTNLGLALLCVNADQIFHSEYLRMYSLLFLLSLCSYWAFTNYLSGKRWSIIILGAVNLLLVYSHYYGWAVIACEAVCVLAANRRKLGAFALQAAVVFACFTPWLAYAGHFAVQRGGLQDNLGWIRRPRLFDLYRYYATLTSPLDGMYIMLVCFVLCGVLMYLGLQRVQQAEAVSDRWRIPLLLAGAFLPPLASFAVSQLSPQSVWGNRHLVIAIVPFYLLIALSLSSLPLHRMRALTAVVVAAWFVLNMGHVLHPRPRINYEVLAEQMVAREHSSNRVPLLVPDRFLAFPLRFQLEQHDPGRWDVHTLKTLDSAAGEHFWVAYHRDRWKGDPPTTLLERRGYRVGSGVWVKDDWQRIIAFPVWRTE